MKRFAIILVLIVTVFFLNSCHQTRKTLTISAGEYYDKTLAGIIGQVAGLLSGFEFVNFNSVPFVGMPDEWFGFGNGPYGGGDPKGGAGVNRVEAPGRIKSDDDYHIDFFNQLILNDYGIDASFRDIKDAWLKHQVSDWGGGYKAMEIMNAFDLIPPFTGKKEFGNTFHWCTEPYIENETLGMNFPGMPQQAALTTGKFASVTGDFDSVTWGKFSAVMYSLAYFEDDVHEILKEASKVLPENSWPHQIYLKCNELYANNPTDWRKAASEMASTIRLTYNIDNIHVTNDVNNGFLILSLLYGNNDYTETCKIASLIGFDSDCTAATATGLMGIIKGMSGTPQEVKDLIYLDGNGVYINDKYFDPHIKLDYPDEQKFTDLARLYQKNAEQAIIKNGGKIEDGVYYINAGEVIVPNVVVVENYDFEEGSMHGWTAFPDTDNQIEVKNNSFSHTGAYYGAITSDEGAVDKKLYTRVTGLKKGKTYKAKAYIMTSAGTEARFFAENYGGKTIYASVFSYPEGWAQREIVFKAQKETADLGLWVPIGSRGWAFIDNLQIEEFEYRTIRTLEAEDAALEGAEAIIAEGCSKGKYVGHYTESSSIEFSIPGIRESKEYLIRINYASDELFPVQKLVVNDIPYCSLMYPKTGEEGVFSANILEVPVELEAGDNVIKLSGGQEQPDIDYIDIIEVNYK